MLRFRSSRTAIAIACTLSLAFTTTLVAITESQASASTCTDIIFVGVRGSGEAPGLGGTIQDTYNAFATKTWRTKSNYALIYPAAPVPVVTRGVSIPAFVSSVNQGSSALVNYLISQRNQCPTQQIVISGYSQGALVVDEGLRSLPADILSRVRAIALYGDPRFNPTFSGDVGTFARNDKGILSSFLPSFGATQYLPTPVSNNARSYCVAYDPVCNYSVVSLSNCLWIARVCAHSRYIALGYTRQGGEFLASRVI